MKPTAYELYCARETQRKFIQVANVETIQQLRMAECRTAPQDWTISEYEYDAVMSAVNEREYYGNRQQP